MVDAAKRPSAAELQRQTDTSAAVLAGMGRQCRS
jgi:hypothetical protein